MNPRNRFATAEEKHKKNADFYRHVLTNVLDDLIKQAGGPSKSKIEKVKVALENISEMYNEGLSFASSQWRSDWSDPANRCAYVFLYLMQHCHLVSFSLEQCKSMILKSWKDKSNLEVCSIGGGPGSDLVGLTTFLRTHGILPSFKCLVLDLYPEWKDTWDTIHQCIPKKEKVTVAYEKCDVVENTSLTVTTRRFIQEADMLTLVKFFSEVSAFFQEEDQRRRLRSILQEIKPGCFVLYIDNQYGVGTQFEREFALPAGLVKVFNLKCEVKLPFGNYSSTVRRYHDELTCWPLSKCNVLIQVYKKVEVQPASRPVSQPVSQVQPTEIVQNQSTDSNSASLAGNSETSTVTQELSMGLQDLSLQDDENTLSESSHLRRTSSVEPDEPENLSDTSSD